MSKKKPSPLIILKIVRFLSDRFNISYFRYFRKNRWGVLAFTTTIIIVVIFVFALPSAKINPPFAKPSPTPSPLYQDFHLVIPALNIDAPVIADVDGANQAAYDKALEGGVAQLKGSAKPGEGSNIFIFGHSSFYWYKPGNYKEIFRNLDDLKQNDEVILWYNSKEYQYQVTSKQTVEPDQVDATLPTREEQVSLMTCVPPGTTLRRLIVVGKLEIGL